MQLRKRDAKRMPTDEDLIVQAGGEGPFPFRYLDPECSKPLCLPIAINTHLDSHIFRSGAEM